jgi:hypothetical protein
MAQHSTAMWFTIDQIGKKLDGTLQDISVCRLPRSFNLLLIPSSSRAPYLISLTHGETAEIVYMTLTTQVAPGAT